MDFSLSVSLLKGVPSVTDRESCSVQVILALLPEGAEKPALPFSGSVS